MRQSDPKKVEIAMLDRLRLTRDGTEPAGFTQTGSCGSVVANGYGSLRQWSCL